MGPKISQIFAIFSSVHNCAQFCKNVHTLKIDVLSREFSKSEKNILSKNVKFWQILAPRFWAKKLKFFVMFCAVNFRKLCGEILCNFWPLFAQFCNFVKLKKSTQKLNKKVQKLCFFLIFEKLKNTNFALILTRVQTRIYVF